tara:strand:- start:105 stop:227 length:123 start_codon:yes stop_codon:yes gene_type:complete
MNSFYIGGRSNSLNNGLEKWLANVSEFSVLALDSILKNLT